MVAKKNIPVVITMVVGLMMIVDYFFQIPAINSASAALRSWGVIVSTFALGLGSVNLIGVNIRRLKSSEEKRKWQSIVLLATLFITTFFGVFLGMNSDATVFMFEGIIKPVDTAMFSMLAFFIGSAAYRAFRFRNVESSILLVVAVIVLLGQIPAGQALFPMLPKPAQWIMKSLNVPGQRGIIISSGIAFVGFSLRVILGLERSHLGESD